MAAFAVFPSALLLTDSAVGQSNNPAGNTLPPVLTDANPYSYDPATGIQYRRVQRTIQRPVVQTETQSETRTVYRPEVTTRTVPYQRTVYTPVVEYNWEMRRDNWWNLFAAPRYRYDYVPRTHWRPETQTLQRVTTQSRWVAENQTVQRPVNVVRMQEEQRVELQPMGRVQTQPARSIATGPRASDATIALARRLRSLTPETNLAGIGGTRRDVATTRPSTMPPAGRIAALPGTAVRGILPPAAAGGFAPTQQANSSWQRSAGGAGRMTEDPPRRSAHQSGMRANDLYRVIR
ncbi:MAG: hypothetical protein AAFP90_06795 [Planctomycetota bacterium]